MVKQDAMEKNHIASAEVYVFTGANGTSLDLFHGVEKNLPIFQKRPSDVPIAPGLGDETFISKHRG